MMTTGDRTFSTAGRTVVTNTASTPIPPGNYTLKIGSDFEIRKAKRSDATPNVNFSFEVEGTATQEGGKNRRVFHRLDLGMKPGKDGMLNMDRENQLTALAKALGTEVEGVTLVEQEVTDENGNKVTIEYLNPAQIVEWLKSFAGATVQAAIKTEKGTPEYPNEKSVVRRYLTA